jgi:hypothetical protein
MAAVDLLLVLLRAAETASLLVKSARLAVTATVDLLLVLLRAAETAGLLIEDARLAVTAVDLLLVLLRGLGGQWLCTHFVSCLFGRVVLGD